MKLDEDEVRAATKRALEDHGESVRKYLLRLSGGRRDRADEAYQAFGEILAKSIGTCRDPSTMRAWARKVAEREFMRIVRKENTLRPLPEEESLAAPPISSEKLWTSQDEKVRLSRVWEKLPPRERAHLEMFWEFELPWVDVARWFRTTPETARQTGFRARRTLKDLMAEDRAAAGAKASAAKVAATKRAATVHEPVRLHRTNKARQAAVAPGHSLEAYRGVMNGSLSFPRLAPVKELSSSGDVAADARLLKRLYTKLAASGHCEDACDVATTAVAYLRTLAKKDSGASSDQLAAWLCSLGDRLSALGRRDQALNAIEEAVNIYRRRAETRCADAQPLLAAAVTRLAECHFETGASKKALAATQEAVTLYQSLANEYPRDFLPKLALALAYEGIRLAALEHRQRALASTQEAAGHYRALAAERPEIFTSDLAQILVHLGARWGVLGNHGEALRATSEAERLYRKLAATRAFEPDLALCLSMQRAHLSNCGRVEEARAMAQYALRSALPLAQALSRSEMGSRGQRCHFVEWVQQSIEILRPIPTRGDIENYDYVACPAFRPSARRALAMKPRDE